jgi:hypothetical protein
MSDLAIAYHVARRGDKALPLLEKIIAVRRETLGADHPSTLVAMSNLGFHSLSTELLEKTIATATEKLGADHPTTVAIKRTLADAKYQADHANQALLLDERKVIFGRNEKLDAIDIMHNKAIASHAEGRLDDALRLYEQTFDARMEKRSAPIIATQF